MDIAGGVPPTRAAPGARLLGQPVTDRDGAGGPPAERWPEIVSYARRGQRLTPGQRRAWERWWPLLGRTLDDLGRSRQAGDGPDFDGWFGRRAPLLMEVGSGMGESPRRWPPRPPTSTTWPSRCTGPGWRSCSCGPTRSA